MSPAFFFDSPAMKREKYFADSPLTGVKPTGSRLGKFLSNRLSPNISTDSGLSKSIIEETE